MRKIFALIGLVALVALVFVPLGCGQTFVTIYDSDQVGHTYWESLGYVHPSAVSTISGVASSFTAELSGNVTSVNVYLKKVGSPTGYLRMGLATVSGTVALDNALPDSFLANSTNDVDVSSLSTTGAHYTFTFAGTTALTAGTDYVFYLTCLNGTYDGATNYVRWSRQNIEGIYDTAAHYHNSGWHVLATDYSMDLEVYGLYDGATPTPTPASGSGGDAEMDALVNAILPWLVPLLICLIPALLGYKFVGELGFFIGLNVGCILAYVTLAGTAYAFPLWGIILVGVMDVAVVLMRR